MTGVMLPLFGSLRRRRLVRVLLRTENRDLCFAAASFVSRGWRRDNMHRQPTRAH